MNKRIIFYCAEGLTIGDICNLFEGNTNAYDYEIAYDEESASVVIREGR